MTTDRTDRSATLAAARAAALARALDADRDVLHHAREILRRHGHGISASCTPRCIGEPAEEPTNGRAILGPGGRRVDISAARHGAPALDIWTGPCADDTCERQHWLTAGYRMHAAPGVPDPPLTPHASLHECVPAAPDVSPSPRYTRKPATCAGTGDVHVPGCERAQ